MHLYRLTLGFAAVVCCCGSGSGNLAPASIDGRWSAYSDGLGSTLTITLSSRGTLVSGTGTYTIGAIRSGSVVIAGTYHPSSAVLAITYDHGETVTFAAANKLLVTTQPSNSTGGTRSPLNLRPDAPASDLVL